MNATTPINPEALLSHMDFVRGIAKSLLFDEHEVDDVVQQTWLQAVRRPPRKAGALKSWLGTVARNLARNTRRDRGRRRKQEEPPEVHVPSTAEVVEREAVRRQVVKAVLALREPYRATVLLRYFEGLSPAQIAHQLKVPGATVRTRLRRGLEQLRTMLDSAHDGNRQAWCLQLVPLAAFVPDPVPIPLPTPSRTTWIATTAAAVLVTGAAVTWSVLDGSREQEPVTETTHLSAEQEPTPGNPSEANKAEETVGEREAMVLPAEHHSVRAAMVGFRGRLVTPAGEPAPGRIVKLAAFEPNRLFLEDLDPLATEPRAPRLARASARTRADGSFVVGGLWPRGNYLLWTDTTRADFLLQVVSRSPRPGEVTDLGDLQLLQGVEVTGRVENQDGEPVEGALVWSSDLNGAVLKTLMFDQVDTKGGLIVHGLGGPRVHLFPAWFRTFGDGMGLPSTRTAADGSFRLMGLAAGQCMLAVHADGHEPYMRQRLRLRPGKTKNLGTIRVRDGEELLGEVMDMDGKPVPRAEVVVAPTGVATRTDLFGSLVPIDFARSPRRADGRGRFQVTGLPKGRVTVAVRRKAGDPWFVQAQVSTAEELRVKLPRSVALKVSLTSKGTHMAPRFKLMQGQVRGEALLGALYRPVDLSRRLTRNEDGDHVIADLVPGTYTLITRAAGHVMTADTVEVNSDLLLHVQLEPAKKVQVRVTDQRGQPVVGACVLARRQDAPLWSRSILLMRTVVPGWNFVPENCGKTDAAGILTMDSLPAGAVHLTVSHPAYGSLNKKVTLNGGPVHVVLEDPGTLKGRFLDGDLPADPDKWILSVMRESGVDDKGPTGMRQIFEQRRDGSFQIEGLTPGEYEVEAIPNPRGVHSANTLKDYVESEHFGFFATRHSAKVTVYAGRTAQVVVNARPGYASGGEAGARISGTFLINGRPAQGCSVMYSDAKNWFATPGSNEATKTKVDAAGRFSLGRLRAGEYKLAAFDSRGAKIWTRKLTVAAGADDVLQVDLGVGSIQGLVLDPEGNPIRNAAVHLMQTRESRTVVYHRVPTDADGRFFAEAMPTGSYTIQVVAGNVGEGIHNGYRVAAGATSPSVTMRLTAYVTVQGTVDMKGFGIEGADYPLIVLEGERWRQEKLAADGSFEIAKVLPGKYSVSVSAAVGKKAIYVHGDGGFIEVSPQGARGLKITKRQ